MYPQNRIKVFRYKLIKQTNIQKIFLTFTFIENSDEYQLFELLTGFKLETLNGSQFDWILGSDFKWRGDPHSI